MMAVLKKQKTINALRILNENSSNADASNANKKTATKTVARSSGGMLQQVSLMTFWASTGNSERSSFKNTEASLQEGNNAMDIFKRAAHKCNHDKLPEDIITGSVRVAGDESDVTDFTDNEKKRGTFETTEMPSTHQCRTHANNKGAVTGTTGTASCSSKSGKPTVTTRLLPSDSKYSGIASVRDADVVEEQCPPPGSVAAFDANSKNGEINRKEAKIPAHYPQQHQPSEYELLRLRNIARNAARLAFLGLKQASPINVERPRPAYGTRKRRNGARATRAVKRNVPAVYQRPTRRSSRILRANAKLSNLGDVISSVPRESSNSRIDNIIVKEEGDHKKETIFQISPVGQYAMYSSSQEPNNASGVVSVTTSCDSSSSFWPQKTDPGNNCSSLSAALPSLVSVGPRLLPPAGLGAIYSLQFSPDRSHKNGKGRVLVGGGKAGIVAFWELTSRRTNRDDTSDMNTEKDWVRNPVMSWKAHSGRWISSVRFVSPSLAASGMEITSQPTFPHLLTASNDGSVCFWDVSAINTSSGLPKMEWKTSKQLHESGIFAMDVAYCVGCDVTSMSSYHVCTGSKDKTLAVSLLSSMGSDGFPIWRSTFHRAKVGAVALRGNGSSLVASASDDGSVCLHDFRTSEKYVASCTVVAELRNAHDRPHSVEWNPLNEYVFMTAGHDETIKIWDVRSTGEPLRSFHGHVPTTRRGKKIHHPTFYFIRRRDTTSPFILTGGEGSGSLSLYRNAGFRRSADETKRKIESVFSRGKLPDGAGDANSVAVQDHKVAVSLEGGHVLLLAPKQ